MTDFGKRPKHDSILDSLPVPMSTAQKERYRRVQHQFDKLNLTSLHVWTRERIDRMLDEAEKFIEAHQPAS